MKTKDLPKEQFVTISKQRGKKSIATEARRHRECFRNPTPRSFFVNAVDKGVSERIGVKAVDKGVSVRFGVPLGFARGKKAVDKGVRWQKVDSE